MAPITVRGLNHQIKVTVKISTHTVDATCGQVSYRNLNIIDTQIFILRNIHIS